MEFLTWAAVEKRKGLADIPDLWPLSPQAACRYPWYLASTVGKPPAWLTWLRYTMFIPLYPMGIAGVCSGAASLAPLLCDLPWAAGDAGAGLRPVSCCCSNLVHVRSLAAPVDCRLGPAGMLNVGGPLTGSSLADWKYHHSLVSKMPGCNASERALACTTAESL